MSRVHQRISLVDMILPDLMLTVADAVLLGRIHFVYSVETMTKIGLEVAVAAAAVGNLSNFDSLEFHKKRKRLLLSINTIE